MNLTEKSNALFLELARDANNWGGTPMLEISNAERGNLTQLKQEGLITTFKSDGIPWVSFTDKGLSYAKENGIEIETN